MKKLTWTLALLAALPLALSAQVSKEDLRKLAAAGISDEVILSYVKANGPVAKLSAEDVIELKQAGASEKLMTSVLSVSSAPPAEPRTNVVQRQAYTAPATTTYVTDSTPYYYTPSSSYYSDYYAPSYAASYSYGSYGPYYPRSYYYSSCYPRSYYYSSSCYPRSYYYSPGLSIGVSVGGHSSRGYVGVGGYRRH